MKNHRREILIVIGLLVIVTLLTVLSPGGHYEGTYAGAGAGRTGIAAPLSSYRSAKAEPSTPSIADKLSENSGSLRYDQLRKLVEGEELKQVKSAEVTPVAGTGKLTFEDGSTLTVTYPPSGFDLADILAKAGTPVEVEASSAGSASSSLLASLAGPLILVLLLGGLFLIVKKQQQGGGGGLNGIGQIKGSQVGEKPSVRFRDVAGCDEAVEELAECLSFMQNPWAFHRLGAKMPNGVLLFGEPGTGKTLLARALAGEAGVPFFSVSGSDFVEMFVGVGAKRVRELFQKARKSPNGAVIFIDEIDAVGGKRSEGGGAGSGDVERERTLNELLVQLDGFNESQKIVVVAATNRKDMLDPALLRPGRLARHIQVPLPSEAGRLAILKVHSKGKPLDRTVDLERLAHITAGSSGADLSFIINEAAIMAARAGQDTITQANLEEAHLRSLVGARRPSSNISEDERVAIAYHEAGHVLCGELCEDVEKAQLVTIMPRVNGAGGLALWGQSDKALLSPRFIHEKLVCALGGRAAEHVAVGTITSGASNDLQQANAHAREAIEKLGFSKVAGQLLHHPQIPMSDRSREIVDREVERVVGDAYVEAIKLLEEHRDDLESLAQALLTHETLGRPEILAALSPETRGKVATTPGTLGARAVREVKPVDVAEPRSAMEPGPASRGRVRRSSRQPLIRIPRPVVAAAEAVIRRQHGPGGGSAV